MTRTLFTIPGQMADGIPYHRVLVETVGAENFFTSPLFPAFLFKRHGPPPPRDSVWVGATSLVRPEKNPMERFTRIVLGVVAESPERDRKARTNVEVFTTSEELLNVAKVLVGTAGHLSAALDSNTPTTVAGVPRYTVFGQEVRREREFTVVGDARNLVTSWTRLGFWLPTPNNSESRGVAMFDLSDDTFRVLLMEPDTAVGTKMFTLRLDHGWHLRYAEIFVHLASLAAAREVRFDKFAATVL